MSVSPPPCGSNIVKSDLWPWNLTSHLKGHAIFTNGHLMNPFHNLIIGAQYNNPTFILKCNVMICCLSPVVLKTFLNNLLVSPQIVHCPRLNINSTLPVC